MALSIEARVESQQTIIGDTKNPNIDQAKILDDLVDWPDAFFNHVLWCTGLIEESNLASINADVLVERGKDFLELHGSFNSMFSILVGRSDNLTSFHATTSEHRTRYAWPVITTVVLIDLRCSAEFTPNYNRDISIQSTFV